MFAPIIAVDTYMELAIRWSDSDFEPDSPSGGKEKAVNDINISAKVVDAIVANTDNISTGANQRAGESDGNPFFVDDDNEPFTYLEDTEPRG